MCGFAEDQSRMTNVSLRPFLAGEPVPTPDQVRGRLPDQVRGRLKIRHFGYACQDLVDAVRLRDANMVIKLRHSRRQPETDRNRVDTEFTGA